MPAILLEDTMRYLKRHSPKTYFMNSVQMHLALTHVPVILSFVGLTMLAVAFFIKNETVVKTSYMLLLIAGISALPVFFSGEGTEEAIENMPGISESVIERHEDVANLAMISISAVGLLSLAALFSFKWQKTARILKVAVLLLALTSGGLMAQTAHLGGQIRHSEIRSGVTMQNGQQSAEQEKNKIAGDSENTIATISMDSEIKWKADEVTKKNVNAMMQVVNEPTYANAGKRLQLYTNLQATIDVLVKECGMKGADHDALHTWLEKVWKDLKELKQEDNEYKEAYATLKKDISTFYQSFE